MDKNILLNEELNKIKNLINRVERKEIIKEDDSNQEINPLLQRSREGYVASGNLVKFITPILQSNGFSLIPNPMETNVIKGHLTKNPEGLTKNIVAIDDAQYPGALTYVYKDKTVFDKLRKELNTQAFSSNVDFGSGNGEEEINGWILRRGVIGFAQAGGLNSGAPKKEEKPNGSW